MLYYLYCFIYCYIIYLLLYYLFNVILFIWFWIFNSVFLKVQLECTMLILSWQVEIGKSHLRKQKCEGRMMCDYSIEGTEHYCEEMGNRTLLWGNRTLLWGNGEHNTTVREHNTTVREQNTTAREQNTTAREWGTEHYCEGMQKYITTMTFRGLCSLLPKITLLLSSMNHIRRKGSWESQLSF